MATVADGRRESEQIDALSVARFIDVETARLRMLSATWNDLQQTRKALAQRELDDDLVEGFLLLEERVSRRLSRALRKHPIWPWLSHFPGLGGAHVATLIGEIGDPRRFPGQPCSIGHFSPPLYAVGDPCPLIEWRRACEKLDGEGDLDSGAAGAEAGLAIDPASGLRCPGIMLAPRPHTGTRSLWHYCGLHVFDGRSPRKRKGARVSWNPRARTSVLQPDGIADQIVRQRVPHYREVYDQAKERLTKERGAVLGREIDKSHGSAITNGAGVERRREIDRTDGLRPIQIEERARKIAAKRFLGDLLRAWKET